MTKTIVTSIANLYPGGLSLFRLPGEYVTAKQLPNGQWRLAHKRKVLGLFFKTLKAVVVDNREKAIEALKDYDNPGKTGEDIFGNPHYPHPLDIRRQSRLALLGIQQSVQQLKT